MIEIELELELVGLIAVLGGERVANCPRARLRDYDSASERASLVFGARADVLTNQTEALCSRE